MHYIFGMTEPTRRPPTDQEMTEAETLIREALDKEGAEALQNIRPLAVRVWSEEDWSEDTLLRDPIRMVPDVSPLFRSVLYALGFQLVGSRSFAIGAGEDLQPKILLSLLQAIPGHAIRTGRASERVGATGMDGGGHSNISNEIYYELQRSPGGSRLSQSDIDRALWGDGGPRWGMNQADETEERWREHSLVTLSSNGSQIHITVSSAWHSSRRHMRLWQGGPDLHLLRFRDKRDPLELSPSEGASALETVRAWGFPVIGSIDNFEEEARRSVVARSVPGSPGQASVIMPENLLGSFPEGPFQPLGESSFQAAQLSSEEAACFTEDRSGNFRVLLDPHITDVIRMRGAKAQGNRDPLRPYQDEAVSLHLATDYGYVNACAPGLGKTLMALQAQREAASKKEGYRSLVVCPAAIRSQWVGEAARFFPEAKVAAMTAREVENDLDTFFANCGSDPALLFLSYDAMRQAADTLEKIAWDDLVCDEAAVLGSTGTARTQALWQLRRVAGRAVALTGTPINKSLDDLGCLVAWARGDERAFFGQKLSRRFDMSQDTDVAALWEALGPTVFRRDRSEIADQLPHIETELLRIDAKPAELALARGAQEELRKIYDRLQEKLEIAETLRPDDPALQQARKDMKKIRGAVLGGVTLARMAASDPGSLQKRSGSAALELLRTSGLLEPALQEGPTKRRLVCGLVEDLVGQNDSVLIFTDFSSVAENIASDLQDAGVRVGTFTGKNSGKRREKAAEDFQAGKLDCLVLTGAGREGLNLQRASVLIHYDLPWVPSQVVQRVGRASRFGSTSDKLQVLIPIVRGTIEERVASVLVPRAVEALRALDSHRGVEGSETEVGQAIGGLEEAAKPDDRNKSLFDLAGEILGSSGKS